MNNKREEIRRGIEKIFKKYKESLQKDPTVDFRNFACHGVMKFLDENNVVLKVNEELPEWLKFKWAKNSCTINQLDVDAQFTFDIIDDAGYVKAERLIA